MDADGLILFYQHIHPINLPASRFHPPEVRRRSKGDISQFSFCKQFKAELSLLLIFPQLLILRISKHSHSLTHGLAHGSTSAHSSDNIHPSSAAHNLAQLSSHRNSTQLTVQLSTESSSRLSPAQDLIRAPLGYLAERAPLGGGGKSCPPPA